MHNFSSASFQSGLNRDDNFMEQRQSYITDARRRKQLNRKERKGVAEFRKGFSSRPFAIPLRSLRLVLPAANNLACHGYTVHV